LPTSEETNRKIHEAVERVERELKQVITYLNDEVVPTVRKESSGALRTAAEQLTRLADYMDQAKRRS
jgi:F0F1-type ATP synthase membrane subunit b/b'